MTEISYCFNTYFFAIQFSRIVHGIVLGVVLDYDEPMLYAYETAYGFSMILLMCMIDTITEQKYLAIAEMSGALPLFMGALSVGEIPSTFLYLIDGILSWLFASYLSSIEDTILSSEIPEARYVGLVDNETVDRNIETIEEVEV